MTVPNHSKGSKRLQTSMLSTLVESGVIIEAGWLLCRDLRSGGPIIKV